MINASPGFYVRDMATNLEWYKDFLGFECTFRVPGENPPPYAIVSHDDVSIHLSVDSIGNRFGNGFCYIDTHNIETLYRKYVDTGVIFIRHLESSSYGMRDFEIKDYEGNRIGFGEKQA